MNTPLPLSLNTKIKITLKKNMSPLPLNINTNWNLGSTLFYFLIIQISTGILLTFSFIPNTYSFQTFTYMKNNINLFYILNSLHFFITSLIFFLMYSHLYRNLKNSSFLNIHTWTSGFSMLMFFMLNAFLGYTLPWGQMSLWAATVITNLLTIIPILGNFTSMMIWGDFSMTQFTLIRFFSFHYMLPILIMMLASFHLLMLHTNGSFNNLPLSSNMEKISLFHYIIKDMMFWIILSLISLTILLIYPTIFLENENFKQANPMNTPPHIKPEWYFLFAYCILRSIPNKLLGVLMFTFSILLPMLFIFKKHKKHNTLTNLTSKTIISLLTFNFIFLTILGAKIVEPPFISISMLFTFMYFSLTIMFFLI